jgi:16S rRNA (uracil1498-N3)-methyltransferase
VVAAHVFVDDLDAPVLSDDDRAHLVRSLRVRDGEPVTVSDGRGGWRPCRFASGGDGEAAVVPDGDVERAPVVAPALTVVMAIPKGDRLEWAVQKVTEIGVDRIVLLHAARSVVRWDDSGGADGDRAARRLDRLRRVVREAAMQSRRVWLPELDAPIPFDGALALPGVCLADAGGGPPSLSTPTVVVGPEGGWADDERAAVAAAGIPRVSFGPHVLRVETAAVAATVLLAALRAGLVGMREE